jgi:hypothetical protein
LFRVGIHGPELQAAERASPLSNPLLGKDDRAGGIELDKDADDEDRQQNKRKEHKTNHKIKTTLDQYVYGTCKIIFQFERECLFMKKMQKARTEHGDTMEIGDIQNALSLVL